MKQAEELIRDIQKGLINWYDFKPGSAIIYIGSEEDALAEVLKNPAEQLVCTSLEQLFAVDRSRESADCFDYVVCIAALERMRHPETALQELRRFLKDDGVMLLGMNNRFGLRYFCGDRDPYTERNFDGIEDYFRAYATQEDIFCGRCYSKAEIQEMLEAAGWQRFRFYSVLSNLENPGLIYAENCLPNEDLTNRLKPSYHCPDTVFLEEENIYGGLIKNGMFHEMANAYLIECSPSGIFSDVSHVTSSMERGRKDALLTVIRGSGIVEKRAAYPEGRVRLEKLLEHGRDLHNHGISVVEANMENGVYTTPYIDGEVGQSYLKRLLRTDREKFLCEMDRFRDLILQSSEIVQPDMGDGRGAVLRKGYLDLIPLNSFYADGQFVFYDQEFCEENYPANAIIARMITSFYSGDVEAPKFLPVNILLERYGLIEERQRWMLMGWEFITGLRKERELSVYHERYRRNSEIMRTNRKRINYPENEYQHLFVDVFHNARSKKLILFGSGIFARKFLDMYGKEYPVYAVVDNNKDKWGQTLEGVIIVSPSLLQELDADSCKVIICIKDYLSVARQLKELQIKDYGVFDPARAYPREEQTAAICAGETDVEPKKYHVGYVAGVFDMFHVGHVNLLRRAKELCDYLIVGVVPDEAVYHQKEKYPVIPCEDRVEVIRACKYADRVEALPVQCNSVRYAYRLFHFDVMFSGDDHGDDIRWQASREFLKKNGADIVFFPYTEKVSSSMLREQLR